MQSHESALDDLWSLPKTLASFVCLDDLGIWMNTFGYARVYCVARCLDAHLVEYEWCLVPPSVTNSVWVSGMEEPAADNELVVANLPDENHKLVSLEFPGKLWLYVREWIVVLCKYMGTLRWFHPDAGSMCCYEISNRSCVPHNFLHLEHQQYQQYNNYIGRDA